MGVKTWMHWGQSSKRLTSKDKWTLLKISRTFLVLNWQLVIPLILVTNNSIKFTMQCHIKYCNNRKLKAGMIVLYMHVQY